MTTVRLSRLRFHLVAQQTLRLPAHNKGNSLRGAFGSAFRKLVCVDLRWECAECTLRYGCPYTKVFNPFIPPDAPRFSGNQNIPRPFVVKPPLSAQTTYAAGEPLVFDLVLVGDAVGYLPYFVVAFRELGATGFGLNRAHVQLARVEAIDADDAVSSVYESTTNLVRPAQPMDLDVTCGVATSAAIDVRSVTLEFLTPTTLKAGSTREREGAVVRRPAFHHVIKRLRDRVNALMMFYGAGPVDMDFKGVGDAAERVETVDDQTQWADRSRFATRRDVQHDLSGFVGRITFRGDLTPFLPLLHAGEYLHVGKNAVFGNGWFRVQAGTHGDAAGSPHTPQRETMPRTAAT